MKTAVMEAEEKRDYSLYLKALGAHIRTVRKERGWTLRDMVMRHGFHLSAWQSYEAGRIGMSLFSLLRVAKALGVPPSELLRGLETGPAMAQASAVEAHTPLKVTSKRTSGA